MKLYIYGWYMAIRGFCILVFRPPRKWPMMWRDGLRLTLRYAVQNARYSRYCVWGQHMRPGMLRMPK